MKLNSISPAPGSRQSKTRKGRGIGSTMGKTCGRGHKGLKARSGGKVKPGFEGGQMPLFMRVPKFGFTSKRQAVRAELRLSQLTALGLETVSLLDLRERNLIQNYIQVVKIIDDGSEVASAVEIAGLMVTQSVKGKIEKAGGSIQ